MANKEARIYNGIDVSAYQGRIDWAGVKAAEIEFAMIRASSGRGSPEKQTDRLFHRNAYEASMAGLYLGAYHSTFATTADEAHREAECFLKVIHGYKLAYPAAVDIEDRELAYLGDGRLNEVVKTWCSDLRAAGCYPMIRADADTLFRRLAPEMADGSEMWVMRKNGSPPRTGYGMWQYAVGTIDGIQGRVNLDRAYKNYPGIIGLGGFNGFKSEENGKSDPASLSSDKVKRILNAISELDSLLKLADAVWEPQDGKPAPLPAAPQPPSQTPVSKEKKKRFFHHEKRTNK